MAARRQQSRRASGPAARGKRQAVRPVNEQPLRPMVFWAVLGAIVVAGAAVRLLAARGELWLDEIWSLRLAQIITSWPGIFTELHHDNNHHLNTLYLSWLPETPAWILYRLHSLAAGIGTIVLAATIGRRAGDRAALTAALLTSGSFLLILYSSEARGYSLAVFWACLAIVLADRTPTTGGLTAGRLAWATGFGVVCALGILSHLSFLHAYAGLVAWTAFRCLVKPWRQRAAHLVALHLVPLACLAALYWIDLRHLVIGGGPPFTLAETVARTLSLSVGGPPGSGPRGLAAAAAVVACVAAITAVRRAGSDLWILFAGTLITPAVMLATTDTSVLFERYFLVAIAFFLLSASWLAADVARRSQVAWAVLVALFLAGNAVHTWGLLERGRGGYVPAMRHMAAGTGQEPVTVGSDHDFRHGGVVEFYRPFVPGASRISYEPRGAWTRIGPDWMLLHSQDDEFAPRPEITVEGGRRYSLARVYRSALLSGWHLALYRNDAAASR